MHQAARLPFASVQAPWHLFTCLVRTFPGTLHYQLHKKRKKQNVSNRTRQHAGLSDAGTGPSVCLSISSCSSLSRIRRLSLSVTCECATTIMVRILHAWTKPTVCGAPAKIVPLNP